MTAPSRRIPGAGLGILLAIGNVCVISIGLAALGHESFVPVLVFVFMFAFIPAVITGAVLGAAADACATLPPVARGGLLGTASVAVIAGLAAVFHMSEYVPFAAVPTLLATAVLERGTRRRVDPPIPVATVR